MILRRPGSVSLPGVEFRPTEPTSRTALVVGEPAFDSAGQTSGVVQHWLSQGARVLVMDLQGMGQLQGSRGRTDYARHAGPNWPEIFLAQLNGESVLARRIGDLRDLIASLKAQDGVDEVVLHAVGEAGVPALHVGLLDASSLKSLRIDGGLQSWQSVLETDVPVNQWIHAAHGVLNHYDLPDLRGALPSRFLEWNDEVDARGLPVRQGG